MTVSELILNLTKLIEVFPQYSNYEICVIDNEYGEYQIKKITVNDTEKELVLE